MTVICDQLSHQQAQPRDRVGGRFFLPDIIEAAQLEPTGVDRFWVSVDPIFTVLVSGS